MKLDLGVRDVPLESLEEGEELRPGSENQVLKANGIANGCSVKHGVPNIAMLEIGNACNLLGAIGADKAKINRGCALQFDFQKLVPHAWELACIRGGSIETTTDRFVESPTTVSFLVCSEIVDLGIQQGSQLAEHFSDRQEVGIWVTLQPSEVTACVMREKVKGGKWERLSDMTMASSGFGVARSPFSPFTIFPPLTHRFRWLNGYHAS